MLRVLADTGPLVALFDGDDRDHDRVVACLRTFPGEIGTTWPVVTEVTHLLDFSVDKQVEFLDWVGRGGIAVAEIGPSDLKPISALMKKYRDTPMDFADATLVFVADRTNTPQIMTLDGDFAVYRYGRNKAFESVLLKRQRKGILR